MIETLKQKIVSFVVHKYVLGWLIAGWKFLRGYKTQIFAVICLGIKVAALLGYLQPEQAAELYKIFGSAGMITLMEKLSRWDDAVTGIISDVKSASQTPPSGPTPA